jgi:small ubiquitin-related modifier
MADNDDVQSIVVRVRDMTGEETHFRIRVNVRLDVVFMAYARRKGVPRHSIRFLLEGHAVNPESTPTSLGLEDGDMIDAIPQLVGMISTFTSNATADPLVHYLMLTPDERATAAAPIAELRAKQSSERADRFLTYHFDANPDVLHDLQRRLLCALLDFVWEDTASYHPTNRVDMRVTLTPAQLETVRLF